MFRDEAIDRELLAIPGTNAMQARYRLRAREAAQRSNPLRSRNYLK